MASVTNFIRNTPPAWLRDYFTKTGTGSGMRKRFASPMSAAAGGAGMASSAMRT
jgi:hypothetical protein